MRLDKSVIEEIIDEIQRNLGRYGTQVLDTHKFKWFLEDLDLVVTGPSQSKLVVNRWKGNPDAGRDDD